MQYLNFPYAANAAIAQRTKYSSVDVYRYRSTFWLTGLMLGLALALAILNYTTYTAYLQYLPLDSYESLEDVEVLIPRTKHEPKELTKIPLEKSEVVIAVDETIESPEFVPEELPIDVVEEGASDHTLSVEQPLAKPSIDLAPPPIEEDDIVHKRVEQMPRFPGCEAIAGSEKEKAQCAEQELLRYIYSNIQYPRLARENNIEGLVVLQFVVERDGSVTGVEVLRDIGAGCGTAARRVVIAMNDLPDKWTPGMQQGRRVNVQYTLPIRFALQ